MEKDIKKDYQENTDTLVTFGDEGYTMRKDDPRTKEAIEVSRKNREGKYEELIKSGEYSIFSGLDLSGKRGDDEGYEDYKARRKMINNLMKIYTTLGREKCIEMYPQGFRYAIEQNIKDINNKNEESPKFKATVGGKEVPVIIKNDEDATTI
jgi:hypothetical protein